MRWDETLAVQAQEWANTCPDGHSGVYGENIFWQLGDVPLDGIGSAASESWASERELQDIDSLSPFLWDANTGHWTQMIWADTDKVDKHIQSICAVVRSTPTHYAGVHTVCGEGVEGYFIESVR